MAVLKRRPTRPKHKLGTIVGALAGIFLFFLPLLALISFDILVDGFIPSIELQQAANLFAAFIGAAFLALLWPIQIKEIKKHWTASRKRQTIQSVALFAFAPLFGAVIGQSFVHGPLNYLLHNLSTQTSGEFAEHVISADDFGGRKCRNRALLENNRMLWHRQVCGISDDAVMRLRRGGHVQLEGTKSRYGIHARRYAVLTANPAL